MKIGKRILEVILAAVLLNCCSAVWGAAENNETAEIYVSPQGKDTGVGRGGIDTPFATLKRARQEIKTLRRLGHSGAIHIFLREGTYFTDTLALEGEGDSGSERAPITYTAYKGERVVVNRALSLKGSQFQTVTNAEILGRLNGAVPLLELNLREMGITDYGSVNQIRYGVSGSLGPALYLEEKPLPLAGWPNEGYVKVSDFSTVIEKDETVTFCYNDKKFDGWQSSDIWLMGYFGRDWAWESIGIGRVDTQARMIYAKTKPEFGVRSDARVKAVNILEELDSPGEWYIDRISGMLYLYPPEDISNSELQLTLDEGDLLTLSNVSYVRFEGIQFGPVQERAIVIEGGSDIVIEGCEFMGIGNTAISATGCKNLLISGNDIHDVGAAGVKLYAGKRDVLEKGNNVVKNNHIYRFGQTNRTYAPAISMGGVGNVASHNSIHDAPHTAIMFGQNETVIEYNDIYNVLLETDDAGAIYAGRDWTARGNVIRYNMIHHSGGDYCVYGIYLDDMLCGTEIYGNLISDMPAGILMGGGSDNVIVNNVLANGTNDSIYADDRGVQKWFESQFTTLVANLNAVPYESAVWRSAYPKLTGWLEQDYKKPMRNVIQNNISFQHKAVRIESLVIQNGTVSDNLRYTENVPGFVSPERLNYRLEKGNSFGTFAELPFESVGLYPGDGREWDAGERYMLSENIAVYLKKDESGGIIRLDLTQMEEGQEYNIYFAVSTASGSPKSAERAQIFLREHESRMLEIPLLSNINQGDVLSLFIWNGEMQPMISGYRLVWK